MRYPAHFVLHAGLPNKYFAVSPKCHRQRSIYHDCVWLRRYRAATNALQYKCPFQSASTCSVESALHSIRPCTLHSIQKSSTSTSTLRRKFFYPLFSSTINILHGFLINCPGDSQYTTQHAGVVAFYCRENSAQYRIMLVHTI